MNEFEKQMAEDFFDVFAIDQAMRIDSRMESEDFEKVLAELCENDEIIYAQDLWNY